MAKKKDLREEAAEEIRKFWGEALKGLRKLGEDAVDLAKQSEGKIVEASKKLSGEASGIARRGEEKIIGASRIGKISLDIMGLKRKKENKLKEIGDKVYLLGPEKIDQPSVKKLCREVKKIESEIKKKEKEIKILKKVVKGSSKSRKKK